MQSLVFKGSCCSRSKAANRVAFAQGLGAQGLWTPLGGPWYPRRLGSPAAAVPVIEPQHVLRHLVVRLQQGARATTCRAVAWHILAELREMLLQSLSLRQAHAEAPQPQTHQPARPGHSEVPAARPLSAWRGILQRRQGPVAEQRVELQSSWDEGSRSPDTAWAGQWGAPLFALVDRGPAGGLFPGCGADLTGAGRCRRRLHSGAEKELKSRRVWPGCSEALSLSSLPSLLWGTPGLSAALGDGN